MNKLLLLMQSNKFQGVPRSGLQMCLDPYKDCYGRNIANASLTALEMTGTNPYYETTNSTVHSTIFLSPAFINNKYFFKIKLKPIGGRKRFLIGNGGTLNSWVLFDTETATIISSGSNISNMNISQIDDNYELQFILTAREPAALYYLCSMPDSAVDTSSRSFAGDTSKGFQVLAYQINLAQLYPYAVPSGLPSNPLNYYKNSVVQNGSMLGADSNDVSFTGLSYKMNVSTNTDNYLLIPKGGEYDNQSTFTCTFVLNATASGGGGYARLFDKAGTSAVLKGILAYIDSNGKINFSRYNGSGNYKTWVTTNAIAWGTTYIVTIKASRNLTDGAVEVFVNGVRQTITTIVFGTPAIADDSANDLILGNRISLDRYFLGDFYTVNWTSKLLSDSDIFGLTKYLKAYWLNKGVTI